MKNFSFFYKLENIYVKKVLKGTWEKRAEFPIRIKYGRKAHYLKKLGLEKEENKLYLLIALNGEEEVEYFEIRCDRLSNIGEYIDPNSNKIKSFFFIQNRKAAVSPNRLWHIESKNRIQLGQLRHQIEMNMG
jgi:hypothetical protein